MTFVPNTTEVPMDNLKTHNKDAKRKKISLKAAYKLTTGQKDADQKKGRKQEQSQKSNNRKDRSKNGNTYKH